MTTSKFFVEDKKQKTSMLSSVDFWSALVDEFTIVATAQTNNLPSITVSGLPEGVYVKKATLMVKFRAMQEMCGVDGSLGDEQEIQAQNAVDGAWTTAIELHLDQFRCLASAREFGDVLIGDKDIKSQIPLVDGVLQARWLDALAITGSALRLEDLQIGLRIWFSIS